MLVILFTQSHHNFALGVYSATLSIAGLKSQSCFTKSHSVVWWIVYDLSGYIRWLIVTIFSTIEWSLYLMRSKPIFSFFYLSNPWLSVPPFQKHGNPFILNSTFISIHLHHSYTNNHNLLLLLRLCPQDDSFKEFYTLHNEEDDDSTQHTKFDFPEPHDGHSLVIGTCDGL